MINRLIELSLRNRFIVIALYVGLAGWGWWALGATPIDAIPDLSDNQVIVFTDWPGHSPQEVEDQVTLSADREPAGLAGVRVVRSQSAFGFSMIYVIFEDNVDLYFARARVLERMSLVTQDPARRRRADARARTRRASGTSSGTRSRAPRCRCATCARLQDWFIRYQLNCRPRRRRSRVGRRLRPAVSDRRRSESAAHLQPAARAPSSPPSATAT